MDNSSNIIPELGNQNSCNDVATGPITPCTPISTSCVYYNLYDTELGDLVNLDIQSGTSLTIILQKIDEYLGNITGANFSGFSLACLGEDYTITNLKEFAEAVACEICSLRECCAFISNPSLDTTNAECIGINPDDTLKQVLEKLAVKICNLYENETPDLTVIQTPSVALDASGAKGHTLRADVKRSPDNGNLLEERPNGLYVTVSDDFVKNVVNNSELNLSDETIQNLLNAIKNNTELKNLFCSICNDDPCAGQSTSADFQDISAPYCDNGVSKKLQQDINKCSPTYNTTRTLVVGTCNTGGGGTPSLNLTINNPTCV